MRHACNIAVGVLLLASSAHSEDLHIERGEKQLVMSLGATKIMTYVWQDASISRPYFCNVRALDGTPITRTHPPDPMLDKANDDHATFHPGIWLAFGDIGGADVWRLKAPVRNESVTLAEDGFAVVNRYEDAAGKAIAREHCWYHIVRDAGGYYLLSRSEFSPVGAGFAFGDQEEMGFGLRLATGLSVKRGGTLSNSAGGENETGTWGKRATWCQGYGPTGNGWAGAVLLTGPENFRPSWFHSRDYGLIVANPFGKKALTAPSDGAFPPDSTQLIPGFTFALNFGVYIHAGPKLPDVNTVYQHFVTLVIPDKEPPHSNSRGILEAGQP